MPSTDHSKRDQKPRERFADSQEGPKPPAKPRGFGWTSFDGINHHYYTTSAKQIQNLSTILGLKRWRAQKTREYFFKHGHTLKYDDAVEKLNEINRLYGEICPATVVGKKGDLKLPFFLHATERENFDAIITCGFLLAFLSHPGSTARRFAVSGSLCIYKCIHHILSYYTIKRHEEDSDLPNVGSPSAWVVFIEFNPEGLFQKHGHGTFQEHKRIGEQRRIDGVGVNIGIGDGIGGIGGIGDGETER